MNFPLSCFESTGLILIFLLQFLQKYYDGLRDLSASVDATASAEWELRLYSCDERMALPETNAYKVLRAQKPQTDEEIELIQGDYIYISEEQVSLSSKTNPKQVQMIVLKVITPAINT